MLNALTIDVEDYFQVSAFDSVVRFEHWDRYESRVERNTQRVLDLLDEYGTKGTFFVLGWVAERYPTLVRTIQKRGHEVASHGYSHQRIYTQTPAAFRIETQRAKRILEDIIGEAVVGYRAATYSIVDKTLWALTILAEEGFRYDSSIFPVRHDLYGIPGHERFVHVIEPKEGGTIAEIPLSTARLFGTNLPVGGGGYLRLFPYPVTRWALRRLNEVEQRPAVVYFHPWEIDPDQPRIHNGWKSSVRHYTNLRTMERSVRQLLVDFSFAPIRELYGAWLDVVAARARIRTI